MQRFYFVAVVSVLICLIDRSGGASVSPPPVPDAPAIVTDGDEVPIVVIDDKVEPVPDFPSNPHAAIVEELRAELPAAESQEVAAVCRDCQPAARGAVQYVNAPMQAASNNRWRPFQRMRARRARGAGWRPFRSR